MANNENEKRLAAAEAVKLVRDGMVLGLGTGSTAYYAIDAIGDMVDGGLNVTAVPTSARTEEQARVLGIRLVSINDVETIDLTIDGTDEFDTDLNLIKGGGGALLKEKMVARMTKQQVIIADSSKKVDKLGAFRIPVEVLPFAASYARRMIERLGGAGRLRMGDAGPFLTDEGNFIVDADFGLMDDPYKVSDGLNGIDGVVCNGLFLDLADMVIVGRADGTEVLRRED